MVGDIPLRRHSIRIFLVCFVGFSNILAANIQINNVGVIPAQVTGKNVSRQAGRHAKTLTTAFNRLIEESERFTVIDEDLIAAQWSTSEGRSSLAKEFELDAYCHFSIDIRDSVVLLGRILGPRLDIIAQETVTISRNRFDSMVLPELDRELRQLTFSLVNRIPLDAYVTSVHGPYATLSGGRLMGLINGQEVVVYRAKIAERHPKLYSPSSYTLERVGGGRVVDVGARSSIVKLTHQSRPGMITAGDGIVAPTVAREYFSNTSPINRSADMVVVPGTKQPSM